VYKRFGLEGDPFTIDPFNSDYTLVNYSEIIEDLLYYTASGSIVLLEGEEGAGKTMMLVQIIKRFKGHGKVVHVDGSRLKKEPDIEKLLNEKGNGLLGNVMKRKPKGMILLLDDVTHISEKSFEKIKYYFDQDYIRSVVFTAHDVEDLHLPPSIMDRIAARHIHIPPMINFDALRIIRDRFSDHFFLPDAVILKLFEVSNKNIKHLLQNCSKVCEFVVKQGRGEVLPKYIDLALKTEKQKQPESASVSNTDAEPQEAEAE
jgi:Cdc6-like AAA superfamily ATPase